MTIFTDAPTVNRRAYRYGLDEISSGFGLGAAGEEAATLNPLASIRRWTEQRNARQGEPVSVIGEFGETDLEFRQLSRLLDAAEANKKYGIAGQLNFSEPIREREAELLNKWTTERLERESILRRADKSLTAGAGRIGAGLLAQALDPLNIAVSFIPVVGPARYARWLSQAGGAAGRAGVRAGVGMAEGALGAALVEPIIYAQARNERRPYDLWDSFTNIAFGSVIGGGLHTAGGAVLDRLAARRAPTSGEALVSDIGADRHAAALQGAVAALAEDRPVLVGAMVGEASHRQRPIAPEPPAAAVSPQGVVAEDRPVPAEMFDPEVTGEFAIIRDLKNPSAIKAMAEVGAVNVTAGDNANLNRQIREYLSDETLVDKVAKEFVDKVQSAGFKIESYSRAKTGTIYFRIGAGPLDPEIGIYGDATGANVRIADHAGAAGRFSFDGRTENYTNPEVEIRVDRDVDWDDVIKQLSIYVKRPSMAKPSPTAVTGLVEKIHGADEQISQSIERIEQSVSGRIEADDSIEAQIKENEDLLAQIEPLIREGDEAELKAADELTQQADREAKAYEVMAACYMRRA